MRFAGDLPDTLNLTTGEKGPSIWGTAGCRYHKGGLEPRWRLCERTVRTSSLSASGTAQACSEFPSGSAVSLELVPASDSGPGLKRAREIALLRKERVWNF